MKLHPVRLFLCLLVLTLKLSSGHASDIFILLLTSSASQFNTSGVTLAVQQALDDTNSDQTLLPGYTLKIVDTRDTECDGATSVRQFLTQVQLSSPTIIGVIGCGCSVATEPVADMTPLYGIPLISYTPGSVDIQTDSKESFYQMYPSGRHLSTGFVSLVNTFGWKQLSIVTENELTFIAFEDLLLEQFYASNVTVLTPTRISRQNQNFSGIQLFNEDARVYILNTFEDMAANVLCAAHKIGRSYASRYVWLLYGWYSEEWWRSPDPAVNCSAGELASVLEKAIVVQQYPIAGGSDTPVGGVVGELDNSSFIETLAYDSVWTLALALNRTMNMIDNNDTVNCGPSPDPLEEFSYTSNSTSCLIRYALSNTNFTGQSGQVRFNTSGVRKQNTVRLLQFRNESKGLNLQMFAEILNIEDISVNGTLEYSESENISSVWPDGVPLDGRTITVISLFHIAAVITMYLFGATGIVFCIICLVFNIVFRKRRIVRLTSPKLNYFIITGALLMYASAFIRLPYTRTFLTWDIFCKVESFFNCIGYTLLYGPILVKMWRVYYIFHNPTTKKKNLKDCHLILIIVVLVSVVLALLFIGFVIPATRPRAFTSPDEEHRDMRNEIGIMQTFIIYNCYPQISMLWLLSLYGYLGVLQIVSLVLAIKTRNVKIKVLNDSKEVAAIIYFTTIALVETLIIGAALQNYNNVSESLYTGHLLVATSATIGLSFIPKMVFLYKDPKGEDIFKQPQKSTVESSFSVMDRNKIASLEKEVISLRARLGTCQGTQNTTISNTATVTEDNETND